MLNVVNLRRARSACLDESQEPAPPTLRSRSACRTGCRARPGRPRAVAPVAPDLRRPPAV